MPAATTTSPAPASAGLDNPMLGTAYLLCFESPGLHVTGNRYARHFIGWTPGDVPQVNELVQTHALLRAVNRAGLTIELVRAWAGVPAEHADRLRKRREAPRLCPTCAPDDASRRAA